MRTVEAEFVRNIARSRNLLEQALPKPALRPSIVAIVDRGRWAVLKRHVAPAASRLENVQDATDDATIIDARFTRLAARQMWINCSPRFVGEPKQARHHNLPIGRTQSEGRITKQSNRLYEFST